MNAQSDPFKDAKSGIRNAQRHLAELERQLSAFAESKPYAYFVETNANGTEDFHKVRARELPDDLANIIFDIAGNLRASLDRAGFVVATAAGTSGKNAHFPFWTNIADVKTAANGRSKDIPQPIYDLMISFKPYKGGNHTLWALNRLTNTNKHESLSLMGNVVGGFRGAPIGQGTNTIVNHLLTYRWPPVWDRSKNEMMVFHVPRGVPVDMNVQIAMFVAITNIDGIDGQPAIGVLNQLVRMVDGIVAAIEAEARRLNIVT
jgi:hypothetical protein